MDLIPSSTTDCANYTWFSRGFGAIGFFYSLNGGFYRHIGAAFRLRDNGSEGVIDDCEHQAEEECPPEALHRKPRDEGGSQHDE